MLDMGIEEEDECELVDEEKDICTWDDGMMGFMPQTEVDRYLQLPQAPHVTEDGKDVDILIWWRDRSWEFPFLSKMARQFLALPCSSAGK